MTGLDIKTNRILEIAMVITDPDLNVIAEGPEIIINQPKEVLDGMNEWCKENLKELRVESENSKISEAQAEQIMLDFLKKHVKEKVCPIGGNSVYMDRLFLRTYFPVVNDYMHYRIIDVSRYLNCN